MKFILLAQDICIKTIIAETCDRFATVFFLDISQSKLVFRKKVSYTINKIPLIYTIYSAMELTSDIDVALFSFGFKHSLPEADTVVDVRFLPNPYYVQELSSRTGLDQDVADYVLDNQPANDFFQHFESFIITYIKSHANAERSSISFAIGCTGGRHRSVAVAEKVRKIIEKQGITVNVYHRDIDKV